MTRETAKARPIHSDVGVSPDTGSTHVTVFQGERKYLGENDYVILIASKHASDSLIDAAVKIAKGADQ